MDPEALSIFIGVILIFAAGFAFGLYAGKGDK